MSTVPPTPPPLLLGFYGDDFTGSTDAMESLARRGVRTVLFTDPPTPDDLARHDGLRAFGVAGMTRSLPPDEMERALRPAFEAMRRCGAPVVHYKVCSTFDSSPAIGSIGRVIDVGVDVFGARFVPLLVGAPALGRYCAFGNLFARCGGESEPYRLDRHPSMSRHPVTPMDEADLARHLAKQTDATIGLLDVLQLERPADELAGRFDALAASSRVVLMDALYERHMAPLGALLARAAGSQKPLFVVGSSGVESALCDYWERDGAGAGSKPFPAVADAGPIVVVCGSCSPVTAGQIAWAVEQGGFDEVALDVRELSSPDTAGAAVARAVAATGGGRSVVVHTRGADAGRADPSLSARTGPALGAILRRALDGGKVRRVVVAGGDTSSAVARTLGVLSVEMVGELTRGSPLCRADAPGSPADGIEITFKGGQIGNRDFFGLARRGTAGA